jgi:hypothetical protein
MRAFLGGDRPATRMLFVERGIVRKRRLLFFLIFQAQCSWCQAQPAHPLGVTDEDLYGVVIRNSRWKSLPIYVCWENPDRAPEALRLITERAVLETWTTANSKVVFVGWGQKCKARQAGIHIKISDEAAHTEAIGRYLDARPNGMVLNFSFKNWSPDCTKDQKSLNFCIYAISAHEFGHALGFTHEQNRNDAPRQCRKEKAQGSVGDYKVTLYDPNSIMNYCSKTWNGNGKLSPLDIAAVQKFYSD